MSWFQCHYNCKRSESGPPGFRAVKHSELSVWKLMLTLAWAATVHYVNGSLVKVRQSDKDIIGCDVTAVCHYPTRATMQLLLIKYNHDTEKWSYIYWYYALISNIPLISLNTKQLCFTWFCRSEKQWNAQKNQLDISLKSFSPRTW